MKSDAYYKNGEDLSFEQCSHEEERARFVAAKAGDEAAKERIIRDHLLLVANIARRIARGNLPENEVISAANYALMKAYENFDPKYPNRFSGYLNLFVRGEIARLWQDRNIVNKGNFDDGEPITSVPLSEETADEHPTEDRDHRSFLLRLQQEAKSVLDERERKIVDLIFNENPLTQADVARKLKITRERVRQIHDVAIAKLGRELRRLMNVHGINQ